MSETQQDRCSAQAHLWRRSTLFGIVHMRCQCGAVHPDGLAATTFAPVARTPEPETAK